MMSRTGRCDPEPTRAVLETGRKRGVGEEEEEEVGRWSSSRSSGQGRLVGSGT